MNGKFYFVVKWDFFCKFQKKMQILFFNQCMSPYLADINLPLKSLLVTQRKKQNCICVSFEVKFGWCTIHWWEKEVRMSTWHYFFSFDLVWRVKAYCISIIHFWIYCSISKKRIKRKNFKVHRNSTFQLKNKYITHMINYTPFYKMISKRKQTFFPT